MNKIPFKIASTLLEKLSKKHSAQEVGKILDIILDDKTLPSSNKNERKITILSRIEELKALINNTLKLGHEEEYNKKLTKLLECLKAF